MLDSTFSGEMLAQLFSNKCLFNFFEKMLVQLFFRRNVSPTFLEKCWTTFFIQYFFSGLSLNERVMKKGEQEEDKIEMGHGGGRKVSTPIFHEVDRRPLRPHRSNARSNSEVASWQLNETWTVQFFGLSKNFCSLSEDSDV